MTSLELSSTDRAKHTQLQQSLLSDADHESVLAAPSTGRVDRSWLSAYAHRLSRTFPDAVTRLSLSVVLLLALVGFSFWLAFVIRDRWLAATRTPASTLSVERHSLLPPVSSVFWQWVFQQEDNFVSADRFVALIPLVDVSVTFQLNSSRTHMPSALQCSHVTLQAPTTICVLPVSTAPPAAESFRSAFSILLPSIAFVFNRSEARRSAPAAEDQPFLLPVLVGFSEVGNVGLARALLDAAPIDAHADPSSPRVVAFLSLIAPMPGTEFLTCNAHVDYLLKYAKTIRLDGSVEWTMAVDSVVQLEMMPLRTRARATAQLRAGAAGNQTAQARLEQMLVDPDLEVGLFDIALGPVSFDVEVTTEYLSYSWASFVSDLGGLLSIGLIVLNQLFPPILPTTLPREFIGAKMARVCCKKRG